MACSPDRLYDGRVNNGQATHYDTLNVAPDAAPEVIDAAYRALSKKYHPDLNRHDPAAAGRMAAINVAYEILSDYGKRYLYDKQLQDAARTRQQTSSQQAKPQASSWQPRQTGNASSRRSSAQGTGSQGAGFGFRPFRPFSAQRRSASPFRNLILVFILLVIFAPHLIGMVFGMLLNPHGFFPRPSSAALFGGKKTAETGGYVRPSIAPNGERWPAIASYIPGYTIGNDKGASEIIIDNTRNNADVFVKLYDLNGQEPLPVRFFYIPKEDSFSLKDISPGRYDLRYKDLDSGLLFKTDAVALSDENGRGRHIKMTLYKVTYNISVNEF